MSRSQRRRKAWRTRIARSVLPVLCAVALAVLAAASAGCGDKGGGGDKVQPQWERVTSAQVSGDRPAKVYLGTYRLGERLRLAWVLSGPKRPPVTLTLRIINADTGTGYGHTVTAQSDANGIARSSDAAISLNELAGEYRIYFSQRFRPAKGPGYDIKLTVYTMSSSR